MKAKWRNTMGVFGSFILILSFMVWWQSREPVYQAKPLSYWVDRLRTQPGAYSESRIAIQAIGPTAVPFLMRQARRQDSAWQNFYRFIWPRLPALVQARIPPPQPVDYEIDQRIGYTLGMLGPAAVPKLIPRLTDSSSGVRLAAVVALSQISPKPDNVALTVANLLNDSNGWVRVFSVLVLADMGAVRANFIPDLVAALKDSDIGPAVSSPRLPTRPPSVVTGNALSASPRLAITSRVAVRGNAALVLGMIGPKAQSAVPELTKLLTDSDRYTRTQAAIALWRIDGATNVLPLLVAELQSAADPSTCRPILSAFAEMGPKAKDASETVAKLSQADGWPGNASSFNRFESPAELRQLAREVLAKIDPDRAMNIGSETP